jgi:hypothetical protein
MRFGDGKSSQQKR